MIKYFKNGVLEVKTLDLPQDCGEINVTLSVEQEIEDACYYLEFSCPRNIKYISQRLEKMDNGDYTLLLPRGISEYMGEVYVQLVIMSSTQARLISRSLIARDPLFVIKESILATNALESNDRRDFFEYAQNVVNGAEEKIAQIDNLIEDMPEIIVEQVNGVLQSINTAIADCNENVHNNSIVLETKFDKANVVQEVGQATDMVMSQKAVQIELDKKFDKVGGTITGGLEVAGSSKLGNTQIKCIEMSGMSTPYIDWHHNNSDNDYDMRMILNEAGKLDFMGGAVNFDKIMVNNREIFPVGSILMYSDETQPASIFGGTWEKLVDRFLVGAGSKYALGAVGGEENHALSINEIPSHNHTQFKIEGSHIGPRPTSGGSGMTCIGPIQSPTQTDSGTTGGNQAHNNIPPYLAVNIWKRIA